MSKEDKDAWLKDKIQNIYDSHDGLSGYRRITLELNNDIEVIEKYGSVNQKRVKRLMDTLCLKAVARVKKYRSYKGEVR